MTKRKASVPYEPSDAFKRGLDHVLKIAKRQGWRTKREQAAFQMGYTFGFSDGIERLPFGGYGMKRKAAGGVRDDE